MSTPTLKKSPKHLRSSDIRSIAQLAIQATVSVTELVKDVHQSVLNTIGVPAGKVPGQTSGITGLVYKRVQVVTQVVGKTVDTLLARLQPLLESTELESTEEVNSTSPQREAVLAALNGVLGDHLLASNNPLATHMSLRYRGQALNWQTLPLIPEATGKVLLLIHGLCMNDLQWHTQQNGHMVDHGETLAATLGYTPVYLRYNSGLHTSQNGRELATQLDQLMTHWPVPIEELTIIAHSMGGLLTRSAFHYAKQDSLRWPDQLKNIVFLGTPHHGAPLERAGNWVDVILGSMPYTAPFAKLGQLRSAGITDLRYGYLLDADWQGHNRFQRRPDTRQIVHLPEGVACYTVAATTAANLGALSNHLIGDGLVLAPSALGQHADPRRRLAFAQEAQSIAYGTNHLGLLRSPEVTRQMAQWLMPVPGTRQPPVLGWLHSQREGQAERFYDWSGG